MKAVTGQSNSVLSKLLGEGDSQKGPVSTIGGSSRSSPPNSRRTQKPHKLKPISVRSSALSMKSSSGTITGTDYWRWSGFYYTIVTLHKWNDLHQASWILNTDKWQESGRCKPIGSPLSNLGMAILFTELIDLHSFILKCYLHHMQAIQSYHCRHS